MTDPLDPIDYADVEFYIRPAGTRAGDDQEYVFEATYEDMAAWSTHDLIETVAECAPSLNEGEWEVGIRVEGDEQYSQRMALSPLQADASRHELENHLAAILNHWRE